MALHNQHYSIELFWQARHPIQFVKRRYMGYT